tara:strand:- start:831 stop:1133 length:303 start_codon:yes stop_codon:yes gene_type:complete
MSEAIKSRAIKLGELVYTKMVNQAKQLGTEEQIDGFLERRTIPLWGMYRESVEPLCEMLQIVSTMRFEEIEIKVWSGLTRQQIKHMVAIEGYKVAMKKME